MLSRGVRRGRIQFWLFLALCIFLICNSIFYYFIFYAKDEIDITAIQDNVVSRTKIICTWNEFWNDPYFDFGMGSTPFEHKNCSVQDCYMIHYKKEEHINKCDAILFHMPELEFNDVPKKRSKYQRYVFFNLESPQKHPLRENYENFFNWTMTYRLDSDIFYPYFAFFDKESKELVSPAYEPRWRDITVSKKSLEETNNTFSSKRKSVAWFISDCALGNDRLERGYDLKNYIDVDIYGKCGFLNCTRKNSTACFNMLRADYYFYLSYENTNCAEYVTEKLSNGLDHDVVPIYYGGANMTIFAPPGSYIDAREMSTEQLASKLQYLIGNPEEYLKYFWWKDYYRLGLFTETLYNPFCKLCEMLHKDMPEKSYQSMHDWWAMHSGLPACERHDVNKS